MWSIVGVFLLGGLLVGTPRPVQGQEDLQSGFTLGVNRVTMQSPGFDLGSYFVFAGGVVLRQSLFGPVSIQSELLLNQKGVEIDSEEGGAIDYGAGYLELPLLIHGRTPPVQSITVHGEAGGFGAIKLFERQTPGEGDLNVPLRTGVSFYRRLNTGVVAGMGATLPFLDQRLHFTVRRTWGLEDVARDVSEQPFPQASFPAQGKTRTWSLLVRFGL